MFFLQEEEDARMATIALILTLSQVKDNHKRLCQIYENISRNQYQASTHDKMSISLG